MSLIPTNPSKKMAEELDKVVSDDGKQTTFAKAFATAYSTYAVAGVGTISEGEGDSSIIENAILSQTTSIALGTAFANYWATSHLTPKSGVASVITGNNALALTPAFIAAVTTATKSIRSEPYFLNLISQVEAVVKTIIWSGMSVSVPPVPIVGNVA